MDNTFGWLLTGTTLSCLSAVVIGIWKLSRWTKKLEDTNAKVDNLKCPERIHEIKEAGLMVKALTEKITTLPCKIHSDSIASNKSAFDVRLAHIEDHMGEQTTRITSVENKLTRWEEKMMDRALYMANAAQKNSPYSVTPYGEYLLIKSFGKVCVDENKEKFFALIDEQSHSTPYDIERAALGVILDAFRTDDTNSVKNFIYNSSAEIEFEEETHQLSTTDIQVAMAIYLRDLYMERNEEQGQLPTQIPQEIPD